MIEIDGACFEGGGQMLRTALALSVVTNQPFRITNIRKNRPSPGLKRQHLTAIKSHEKLCSAHVSPHELGTTELTFKPGKFAPKKFTIDIETAGSITLLLQSLLVPMVFASETTCLTLRGGTDVPWSMPIDYFNRVVVPSLGFLADISVSVTQRGFFPRGGGEVEVIVEPKGKRIPFNIIEQGRLTCVRGIAFATTMLHRARVAERMANQAAMQFDSYDCPVSIEVDYGNSLSDGAGIVLWSEHAAAKETILLGADALGKRGLPAEKVANTASDLLKREMQSGAAVDRHMADNLVPFLGLLGGKIKTSEVSAHTLANIYITESFLGVKFAIDEKRGVISVVDKQKFSHDKRK